MVQARRDSGSVWFSFSCVPADYIRTIHETTPNPTNKAASCGFVDRFSSQADLSKLGNKDTTAIHLADTLRLPNTPLWRWWFLRGAIDRTLFQHAHCFRHGALELRIAASNHFFGPVLDIDVRRHAFVLNRPSIVTR